jgi:hypothetical protein
MTSSLEQRPVQRDDVTGVHCLLIHCGALHTEILRMCLEYRTMFTLFQLRRHKHSVKAQNNVLAKTCTGTEDQGMVDSLPVHLRVILVLSLDKRLALPVASKNQQNYLLCNIRMRNNLLQLFSPDRSPRHDPGYQEASCLASYKHKTNTTHTRNSHIQLTLAHFQVLLGTLGPCKSQSTLS